MNKTLPSAAIFSMCLLIPAFILTGCTLLHVREETDTLKKSVVLTGIVSSPGLDIPVVVAAYSGKDSGRSIVHYTTLHEPGPYELMVPKGVHSIVAFGDRNKNLTYGTGGTDPECRTGSQVHGRRGRESGYCDDGAER